MAWIALAAGFGMVVSTAPATGTVPTSRTGTLQGAPYRLDVPANWNGDLVMLMHGYEPKGAPPAT